MIPIAQIVWNVFSINEQFYMYSTKFYLTHRTKVLHQVNVIHASAGPEITMPVPTNTDRYLQEASKKVRLFLGLTNPH